ncbi:MAG: aspartate:alanine exchanger family transporter [Burkholderiales bacterium]
MEFLKTLLEQQPMLALFLTIALGYLAGEINIKGFSLGAGAVLFVAIAVGWFAPKSAPAPMIGSLGLALFLYTVGIQYGKQFFMGLTSAHGIRANVMAVTGVLLAGATSLAFVKWMDISPGMAFGLFAGAGTSTATLQAALASVGNTDPATGYSVAYPFGVAGPILFLYVVYLVLKPKFEAVATGLEMHEIVVHNPGFFGKPLGEIMTALPAGVQIVALRRAQRNEPASPAFVIAEEDVLFAVGPTKEALAQAARTIGEAATGRFIKDRRDLDYLRVFASRPTVVGRPLGDLEFPGEKAVVVLHVRRGDADLLSRPDLILEFGDRIGLLANRAEFPALRKYFGDSIRGTAEVSYISVGLGMALGFLVGAVSIPIPGIGKMTVGFIGVLLVALILGNLRRTGGINWTMPLSANKVLFNLGLTLFLANAGMSTGASVVSTVAETGFLLLGLGAVLLVAIVLPVIVLGLFVFRMSYDEMAGILAGATGNPAILAYSNKLAPTDRPDVGYAMIFPSMTILKILFVNVAAALVL